MNQPQNAISELNITVSKTSPEKDFDFLVGKWRVHNKKLKTRLSNSKEWTEFETQMVCRKILRGFGNTDEYRAEFDGVPWEALALRLFNPKTSLWSIYWVDSNTVVLQDVPEVGSFDGNIGKFYAKEVVEGREVLVQFYWDKTNPDIPFWSQAFSPDDGKTWEWNWYMTFHRQSEQPLASQIQQTCCPVVELRQYTLHPGKRDTLIDLFDREFVESQEALRMKIIGQFRDLDEPNRFVWLRGFDSMSERAKALTAFYGGPVWKANREAANATMVDSDNVLLLRPARPASGFPLSGSDRPPVGANEVPKALMVATIYYFDAPVSGDFLDLFERQLKPVFTDTGALILAYFVTEDSPNTFRALPVREGENVFIWFSQFQDQSAYENHIAALALNQRWTRELSQSLAGRLKRKPEILRLSPTARSQLYARYTKIRIEPQSTQRAQSIKKPSRRPLCSL